jgi:hypothetical protein
MSEVERRSVSYSCGHQLAAQEEPTIMAAEAEFKDQYGSKTYFLLPLQAVK